MKKILLILFIFILFSCNRKVECREIVKIDTIYVENTAKIDSLVSYSDSLKQELQLANFKLERIKYYNNIASKGNNIKFLKGWINRVLND